MPFYQTLNYQELLRNSFDFVFDFDDFDPLWYLKATWKTAHVAIICIFRFDIQGD